MGPSNYSRSLRAIGQSLDAQRIHKFELKPIGDTIQITGQPEQETDLLAMLKQWQRRLRRARTSDTLTYMSADIDQLDLQGRALRLQAGRLPDLYSLSNTMRVLGAYLDDQKADLITLNKHPLNVSLLYRDGMGFPHLEERTVASFHDWFLQLHKSREKKSLGN